MKAGRRKRRGEGDGGAPYPKHRHIYTHRTNRRNKTDHLRKSGTHRKHKEETRVTARAVKSAIVLDH